MRKWVVLCLLGASFLFSCERAVENVDNQDVAADYVTFVINQGNFYDGIAGSLDALTVDGRYERDVFARQNGGMTLGDTPQAGVIYGTKLYVVAYESNLVWVLDRKTAKIVKRLEIKAPENVCASAGKVFVTTNDGYLNALDTLTMTFDARVAVGPNPMGCAVRNDEIFVAVSDGYNYNDNYVNGRKVAVVNPHSMQVVREIAVGLNPTQVVAGADAVYVVCSGNYADVLPEVWKITDETAEKWTSATHVAALKNGEIMMMNVQTDWTTHTTSVVYSPSLSGELPPAPTGVFVSENGHIFVTSDAKLYDYVSSGSVYEYDEAGRFLRKFSAGAHPYGVVG